MIHCTWEMISESGLLTLRSLSPVDSVNAILLLLLYTVVIVNWSIHLFINSLIHSLLPCTTSAKCVAKSLQCPCLSHIKCLSLCEVVGFQVILYLAIVHWSLLFAGGIQHDDVPGSNFWLRPSAAMGNGQVYPTRARDHLPECRGNRSEPWTYRNGL